ncbi:hypothetical protein QLX08_000539 [Tetragonisca angustula]|uniref:Uncharacterized protein n=1 Tax=Tetragonisca angustula TaxID=166442 RepID=A0AAW1AL59_9HYME
MEDKLKHSNCMSLKINIHQLLFNPMDTVPAWNIIPPTFDSHDFNSKSNTELSVKWSERTNERDSTFEADERGGSQSHKC